VDAPETVRVLLFIRNPGPGKVKTRLARDLGEAAALELYEACVLDTLDTLGSLEAAGLKTTVYCQPANEAEQAAAWLGGRRVLGQHGRDLGERMRLALAENFGQGAKAALVLGSDVPQITPDILRQAAGHLAGGKAVIGPALDGGYYLIGFTRPGFCPQAFQDIPWGGPRVLELTLDRLRRHDITPALLPGLRDLDTRADALALAGSPATGEAPATRTRAVVEKIFGEERKSGGKPLL